MQEYFLNSITNLIKRCYETELERYNVRSWAKQSINKFRQNDLIQQKSKGVNIQKNEKDLQITLNFNERLYIMKLTFYSDNQFRIFIINQHQKDPHFNLDNLIGPISLEPLIFNIEQTENTININIQQKIFKITLDPISVEVKYEQELIASFYPIFIDDARPSMLIKYFKSPYLSGIPSHADSLLLKDTIQDRPYQLYTQDRYLWPVDSRGGMYGANPVLFNYGMYGQTVLFWRNVSETYFDLRTSDFAREVFVISEVNDLDAIVTLNINGPINNLYKTLQPLIGKSFFPPLWSLSHQHSRYSFMSSKDLLDTEAGYDYHKIPVDAFYLDLDHTQDMKYFTWNENNFKDPSQLLDHFYKNGRYIVTIQDPHIKQLNGYHVYDNFKKNDLLIKQQNEDFIGKAWPGDSVYVDFIDFDAQEVWSQQYDPSKYKNSQGISVWNDLNEPTVFNNHEDIECLPKDCEHKVKLPDNTKQLVYHRQVRLCYGLLQMKATAKALDQRDKHKYRNICLTRSYFTGIQKYAIVWTADAESTFKYLYITTPMLLSYSLVGMSFSGADVPGFMYWPEEDLCRRWYQLGSFQPFFRSHSNFHTPRREPWLFSAKTLNNIRKSVLNRYKLLPHWYTIFFHHYNNSMPILRPLWMNFPQLKNAYDEDQIHCLGDSIIIVPVTSIHQKWVRNKFFLECEEILYDYWTGKQLFYKEQQLITIEEDYIPVFIRGGSILPIFNVNKDFNCSNDLLKNLNIELLVYLDTQNQAKGNIYLDDGISYEFESGTYLYAEFKFYLDTFQIFVRHNGFQLKQQKYSITKISFMKPNQLPITINIDINLEQDISIKFQQNYQM